MLGQRNGEADFASRRAQRREQLHGEDDDDRSSNDYGCSGEG